MTVQQKPECPRRCEAEVRLVDSPRWGTYWRCAECGHEWKCGRSSATAMRARIAAYAKWARTDDRTAATSSARSAFLRRFEVVVDPAKELPEEERIKRAEYAIRAHMTRLALRSVQSRRRKQSGAAA
ncbi:MAG: hypothetical protein ACREN8_06655 [Candidatus Dormibacteraceae bacterium]